jgi:uncharacterized membrane protein
MRNALLAIAIGLVGAALIHIVIILALPMWTGKDAWTRVEALGDANRFYSLANEPNITGLYNEDPISAARCVTSTSPTPGADPGVGRRAVLDRCDL